MTHIICTCAMSIYNKFGYHDTHNMYLCLVSCSLHQSPTIIIYLHDKTTLHPQQIQSQYFMYITSSFSPNLQICVFPYDSSNLTVFLCKNICRRETSPLSRVVPSQRVRGRVTRIQNYCSAIRFQINLRLLLKTFTWPSTE